VDGEERFVGVANWAHFTPALLKVLSGANVKNRNKKSEIVQ